jgi:tetratricopeptide (TPR) repeat protein
LCREAIENAEKSVGTGHPAYGSRLNILAELYISMGEYDKAIKLHKESMTNAETNYGKNHATYAIRIGNLANAYKLTKQYEKALTLNQESIAIFEKTVGKEHHFYGQSLNNLAILYENMGEFDKSLPLQLQALEITEKSLGKENTSYVSRVANLATLYRSMGDYEKSLPLTIEALEITQRLLGNKHAIYGFYTNDMAGTYEMMGDYEKAEPYFVLANENLIHRMEQLFQFRSEKELKAFLLKTRFHFDIYQSFGYRTNGKFPSITETNLNNQLLLKGMLLNHSKDILNKLCELNDKEINKKVARLKSDKTYLTKQYSLLSNKRIAGMDSLIESVNNQEAELVKSYGDIFGQTTELAKSWREIQAKLEPKDVAIEFSHFKHRNDLDWAEDSILYIAYIIKRGWSEPKLVYLFEEKELKNILQKKSPNQLYSTRGVSLSDNASSVYFADSIYKLIWKPLMLQLKGVKRIYYSADGLLHQIPFAALSNTKSQTLGKQYNLVQMSSTSNVLPQNNKYYSGDILLAGGIDLAYDTTKKRKGANKHKQSNYSISWFW